VADINNILLVDDEPDIRTIAELSLSQVGGWKVTLASSGVQALELAGKHKPDLILLDVMMPEMDGVATFQALANRDDTREIPVIFRPRACRVRSASATWGSARRG
jgi:CheY-like chemotaxis protein